MAASFREGWRIQRRVISALMIRELTTRFGRENIGFLWIMAEPLLFAGLVAVVWRFIRGPEEHGINITAFIVTGYIPLTFFRHSVNRAVGVFTANSSLMYHRQIKILDFILVRVFIELIGGMMAYVFIGSILYYFDVFPMPDDMGLFIAGWFIYALFALSLSLVLAPLSEQSELLEKLVPVTTYIMIPFSGTFNMASWLSPRVRGIVLWFPPANAMEMMRAGIFGPAVTPYYSVLEPIAISGVMMVIGLTLCRRARRTLVVE